MADIFVSYTSKDRDWAFWIGQELERLGHTSRLHEWEISGGGDISRWMEERHNSSDHILCVVSKAYLEAPYSSWERRAAQWAATTSRPNFVLPVFVESCEPPTLLAPIKRCDLHGLDETVARDRLADFMKPAAKPLAPLPFPRQAEDASLGQGHSHAFPSGDELSSGKVGVNDDADSLLEQILPRPPALVALPRYLASHAFVGRDLELQRLSDWCAAADSNPMLLLEAIGGSGKSMLTWEWLTKHARFERPDWAGLFWYSFYEKGAVMADFCCHALAYMTQRPIRQIRKLHPKRRSKYLVEELQQRPWLVVLDGLERVLVAYHRHDAAQMLDSDAVSAIDQINGRDPCSAIRSEDDDLLRQLASAEPSKVLVSSRLTPRALINSSHMTVPGVRREVLPGLRAIDAEAMIRRCGISGDSNAIRAYLQQNCDCHPLVVGALAGLINDYPYDRGNFDKWLRDLKGGVTLNLGELDLTKRQNHILRAAINALPSSSRRLLHLLSVLNSATDFRTLEALVLGHKANAPAAGVTGESDREPTNRQGSGDLPDSIRDLEKRGLLQYDTIDKRYDLHPVVRGVASARIAHEETRQLGQNVVDYFTSKHRDPWDKANTLAGVADGIQIVSAFLRMQRYTEAFQTLEGELANALYFNLSAHAESLSLVRGFFPDGWDGDPALSDQAERWYVLNFAAASMSATSEKQAEQLYERAIAVSLEASMIGSIYVSIVGLAGALSEGREVDIRRLYSLASVLAQVSGESELVFISKLREYKSSILKADWQCAEGLWNEIDPMGRSWTPGYYRPGEAEGHRVFHLFHEGRLTDAELAKVEQIAAHGNNRPLIRSLHEIRGELYLKRGAFRLAADHFSRALAMYRENGLASNYCEARLAVSLFFAGDEVDARGEANRITADSVRSALAIADLWKALSEREKAVQYAELAYSSAELHRFHGSRSHLDAAAEFLADLGANPPSVQDEAPAEETIYPWEESVLSLISKQRGGAAATA